MFTNWKLQGNCPSLLTVLYKLREEDTNILYDLVIVLHVTKTREKKKTVEAL